MAELDQNTDSPNTEPPRRLTVVVTGATGAIGSRCVQLAVEAGHDVIAVARDDADMPEAARPYTTRLGDLTLRHFCQQAVVGADVVIHCAALNDPSIEYEALVPLNVESVRWLYEAAEDAGVRHFIHISTSSLYKPRRGVLNEDAEFDTHSNYALTKEEAERFLRSRPSSPLPWTILRPSLTYGPRGRSLGSAVILLPPLLRLFFPYVPALTGGPRNNWVHTTDVARAALFVAAQEQCFGQVYNVADDTPLSQGEILSAAIQAYGLPIGPTFPFPTGLLPSISRFLNIDLLFRVLTNLLTPLWGVIEQRHGLKGELRLVADRSVLTYLGGDRIIGTDKLKALGWKPEYPDLRSGMAETIQWYQDRRWIPDYRALTLEEVDYSDTIIKLYYKEHYEGRMTPRDGGEDVDCTLETTVTFPNVKQLFVDREALVEGEISIEGLVDHAPITGTLKVAIVSAQMQVQFAFDSEQEGHGYRFVGAKKFGLLSVIPDFANLDGTIYDRKGDELGEARFQIDLSEGLVKTLLSLRLG